MHSGNGVFKRCECCGTVKHVLVLDCGMLARMVV